MCILSFPTVTTDFPSVALAELVSCFVILVASNHVLMSRLEPLVSYVFE